MLRTRIITAVVLLAFLLPALFYPSPEPFCVVTLVLIAAGAWEWGRLIGLGKGASLATGLFCLALCMAAWAAGLLDRRLPLLWTLAGSVWVLAGAWLLRSGSLGWSRLARPLRWAGGLAALSAAWLAVAQARVMGTNVLLSVLLLVWVADIAAYFAGRAFGRRKLAPSISPGKSWEGVWGGMGGVLVLAFAWVWADAVIHPASADFYSRLALRGYPFMVLAVLFMAGMSVVGDLAESLVKRAAGVKDSSGLLPGHGGVLDRVDALLPTLPLALMLASL